jgi:hypothetical protein
MAGEMDNLREAGQIELFAKEFLLTILPASQSIPLVLSWQDR